MTRILAAAALAVAGFAVPAHADATVCLGGATVTVGGQPVVAQDLGCHTVPLP